MNCKDVDPLIHAYIDKELDAANALALEQHLQRCHRCQQEYDEYLQQQSMLKKSLQRHLAPAGLLASINAQIDQQSLADQQQRKPILRKLFLGGSALVASLALSIFVITIFNQHQAESRLLAEVLDEHVGAIHAGHLTDISSHDVKKLLPWFARKLDYSPRVYDFSSEGYRMLGGRLGTLQNKRIASIAYQHQDHIVNLYTWPSPDVDDAEQELHIKKGYHLLYWCQNKMNYWIVSDMNAADMKKLAAMLQQKLHPRFSPN